MIVGGCGAWVVVSAIHRALPDGHSIRRAMTTKAVRPSRLQCIILSAMITAAALAVAGMLSFLSSRPIPPSQ
jgi:ABC-type Fe3+-siderophore transport system permease subunit